MSRHKLQVLILRLRRCMHRAEHKYAARVALWSHLSYYVLVTMEAHGNYRYAAGAVALVVVYEAFVGHSEPPS
jgi:hypothetical protein